jgi:penicillin-binding protein 1C
MGMMAVHRRKRHRGLALVVALTLLVAFGASLRPIPRERLHPRAFESFHLVDRHGVALGESLTAGETSASWTPLEELSPDLAAAAVAAEDKRFYSHHGLDPLAISRAFFANLRARHRVSGASTITQQVARMILSDEARAHGQADPPRSLWQKVKEAHLALRLERSFTKHDLLEAWLNRVPVGGVAHGVTAGAWRYFGEPPSALSLEQSALLIGLPRGPTVLLPQRSPVAAKQRRDRVLEAMVATDITSRDRIQSALASPVNVQQPRTQPMRARLGAWMASEIERRGGEAAGTARSTIDAHLEERIEKIIRKRIEALEIRGVKSAAVVVIDHRTDQLLALVGSADETDPRWGQVHAAFALRQPGSALKPFVYLTALEHGKTLASLAADIQQAFPDLHGAYLPENYDKRFHGPVRYRDSLAQSLNVAAVDVLRTVGVRAAADTLEAAGISTISREPEHYGLGLTLGSLDIQLLELTEAYAVLARQGIRRPTRVLLDDAPGEATQVFDPGASFLIADALADPMARAPQFGVNSVLRTPYWTAVKTGTSKNFRDNFCLGFSERYTVGVWVGDPEGHGMRHVSGVAGAGPIWRDVMDYLHRELPSHPPAPPATLVKASVCPLSGQHPGPHCPGTKEEWFIRGTEPTEECGMHQHVALAKSDGLPVPPHCSVPASPAQDVVVWPSPYDNWAVPNGLGVPDVWTKACPAPPDATARPPRLLSPTEHEVIRLDPERSADQQQLLLLADAGKSRTPVEFLVDGEELTHTLGPHSAMWSVTRGEHRITARFPGGSPGTAHVVVVR